VTKHEFETKSKIILDWMQDLLKEPIPGATLQEKLADGVVLCKIANALKPGCVRRFHRKPKMLMMKLENIAFFLAVCKSRFGVGQTSLFSPQDVHEISDDNSNMLRVLTVLMLLIKEGGFKVDGLDLDSETAAPIEVTSVNIPEKKDVPEEELNPDDLISPRDKKETEAKKEEEDEDAKQLRIIEEQLELANKNAEIAKAKLEQSRVQSSQSIKSTVVSTPTVATVTTIVPQKGSWYLQGKLHEYIDIQPEVKNEILHVIHNELCIESKMAILSKIVQHNTTIEEKILYASDNELRQLCFEMGLGDSVSNVPQGKERRWYVDWIMMYGRSSK